MNPQLHGGHGPEKHCVSWKGITEGMKCADAEEEGWWPLWRPGLRCPRMMEAARGTWGLSACSQCWVRLPSSRGSSQLETETEPAGGRGLAGPARHQTALQEAILALDGASPWASQNFSELQASQSSVLPPLLHGCQTYFMV